jgi:hypothetical protein
MQVTRWHTGCGAVTSALRKVLAFLATSISNILVASGRLVMHLSVLPSPTNRTYARLLGGVSYISPLIAGLLIVTFFLPPPEMFPLGDSDEDFRPSVIALVPSIRSASFPRGCQRQPHQLNNATLPRRSIARVLRMHALDVRRKDGRSLLRSLCLLRC